MTWLAGLLRPFVSPPIGAEVTGSYWVLPALLTACTLTGLYEAWVILTGWSGGEVPRRAWMWAAGAMSIGLATGAAGSLLAGGVIGFDPSFYVVVTILEVAGLGGGLLFVAAVADGLGASPARE